LRDLADKKRKEEEKKLKRERKQIREEKARPREGRSFKWSRRTSIAWALLLANRANNDSVTNWRVSSAISRPSSGKGDVAMDCKNTMRMIVQPRVGANLHERGQSDCDSPSNARSFSWSKESGLRRNGLRLLPKFPVGLLDPVGNKPS
jgi:hypothetical protein